jgi:hypothetical protein
LEFGFSEVLVVASWRLHLPEISRDPLVALYRVPTSPGAARAGPAEPAASQLSP